MYKGLFKTALMTSAVLATFIVATVATETAASGAYPTFQNRQQELANIEVTPQSQGYIMMAGATVRDHRTNKGGTSGNWSGTNVVPPPSSPGFGQGGVSKGEFRLPIPVRGPLFNPRGNQIPLPKEVIVLPNPDSNKRDHRKRTWIPPPPSQR